MTKRTKIIIAIVVIAIIAYVGYSYYSKKKAAAAAVSGAKPKPVASQSGIVRAPEKPGTKSMQDNA